MRAAIFQDSSPDSPATQPSDLSANGNGTPLVAVASRLAPTVAPAVDVALSAWEGDEPEPEPIWPDMGVIEELSELILEDAPPAVGQPVEILLDDELDLDDETELELDDGLDDERELVAQTNDTRPAV